MNSEQPARRAAFSLASRLFLALALGAAAASAAAGQAATDASTPPGLASGAPAGSYSLSGFDNVNLYNGHLNSRLPLLRIGGRGSAGYTMMLAPEQKWLVQHWYDQQTNTHYYWPDPNWWSGLGVGLGAGTVEARHSGVDSYTCEAGPELGPRYFHTVTRLTFKGADGTEYELVDKATLGKPNNAHVGPYYCTSTRYNRGREFVTADGTAATFVSDTDIYDLPHIGVADPQPVTGYLHLRDGTRYRVVDAVVREIRDRNGNRVTLGVNSAGSVTSVTDSLGRVVTVEYNVTDPHRGAGTRINYKGFGGSARSIFISQTSLSNALRAGYSIRTYSNLFNLGSDHTPFNPAVVSAVWLPDATPSEPSDDRSYQFRYNDYGELARVVLPTGGAFEYDYQGGLTDGPDSGLVQVGWLDGGQINYQVYRRVVRRRVYRNAGDATPESTMTVSRPERYGSGVFTANGILTDGYVETTQRAGEATGTILAGARHHFYGSAAASMDSKPGGFSPWREGREHKTEALDANGTALTSVLRRVEHTWQQRAAVPWWSWWVTQYGGIDPQGEPANDPRLVTSVTTVEPSGANLVSKQTAVDPQTGAVGFDQYNNPTDVWEYDFGATPGTVGAFARRTHTDYVTAAAYVNSAAHATPGVHLRGLPSASWVSSDAGGANKVSRAVYEYDNYSTDARHAPLVARANITGHDAAYTASFTTRGNQTGVTSYADAAGQTGAVTASTQYDVAGNAVGNIDALERATTIAYDDSFCNGATCGGSFTPNTYAFPTSTTSPVPDPSGQYGSQTPLATSSVYDFWTGLVASTTDANNQVTNLSYADEQGVTDPLDRLRKVVRPGGVSAGGGGQTLYDYGDTPGNLFVRTRTAIGATRSTDSYQYSDGLGRPFRSLRYENHDAAKPWVTADTEYDALGRVRRVSLPYRAAAGAALFSTDRWMENAYDALGRVKATKTMPDTATVTTDYGGNSVTVTDQAGKKRRSVSDALGRLASVTEAPEVAGCQADGAGCTTSYTYDALGNLRKVTQGAQLRYFMYDSLSRLVRAKNPEQGDYTPDADLPALTDPVTSHAQWSLAYAYDANGNLRLRKDARDVKTTYGYDALNRNTTVRYADAVLGAANHTKDVNRHYDGATNGRGRFHFFNWDAANNTRFDTHLAVDQYDSMGRPRNYRQHFLTNGAASAAYTVEYTYDLAGSVTSQKYPSGRTANYRYDLLGRPADEGGQPAFSGNLGDGVQRTYASEISYHELGGVRLEKYGTDVPLYNRKFYNSRGQLAEIRVGTFHPSDDGWWNRGAIINHYSTAPGAWGSWNNGPDNNGNLKKQEVYVPNQDFPNTAQINDYTNVVQDYGYDALNRLTSVYDKPFNGPADFYQSYTYDRWGNRTVNAGGTWNAPAPNFTVNPTTNRLQPPAGHSVTHDAAGNLTNDSYTGYGSAAGAQTRFYDAEHRMVSARGVGGLTSVYVYDADGRRVKRNPGAGGEVWQVYGMGGELLAEYSAGAAPSSPRKEYGYRGGELLITAEPPQQYNVAAAASGATAAASTFLDAGRAPLAAINGDRKGIHWGSDPATGSGWHDSTPSAYPDRLEVTFGGSKTISEVHVFSVQDNVSAPSEPTEAMTFSLYGLTDFYLEYWTGSAWAAVPGGAVSGNNKVWRKVTFAPVTTTKLRVVCTGGLAGHSRIIEVEAYEPAPAGHLRWLVADQLGTPRMALDRAGSLAGVRRHDYLPFGEEVAADPTWRTTGRGYAGDDVRQKFTGYERDSEVGLDFAQNRSYSPATGRFTGVDLAGPNLTNPQTLNKYQYCLNNPFRFVDRNGLYEEDVHRDLTRVLAYAAGFSMEEATSIAAANQGVDDDPATDPTIIFPLTERLKVRAKYHFTSQARRSQMWSDFETSAARADARERALSDLGVFFHAQQDSFSHWGYTALYGHMKDGSAPDKTYNRVGLANFMAWDTYLRLSKAATTLQRTSQPVPFSGFISRNINSFNAARTAETKNLYLTRIVWFVTWFRKIQERPIQQENGRLATSLMTQ
jgi:RHS repeat-associated protein